MPRKRMILVMQHGWVLLARPTDNSDQFMDVSVIRRWGTKKGLGELVSGPAPETVMDRLGRVQINRESILFSFEVDW